MVDHCWKASSNFLSGRLEIHTYFEIFQEFQITNHADNIFCVHTLVRVIDKDTERAIRHFEDYAEDDN